MAQDPLSVLWIEPRFPGRLGAVADWLVRRRGYRCTFCCQALDTQQVWPTSVGHGLDVQVFGVGGVAAEPAAPWQRTLERSLCYSYGCWELLDSRRPRPVDLVVGRSAGLGSTLFAQVYAPAAPVINLFDYYLDPLQNDLTEDMGASPPPAYRHWRRSANAIDLLDLENCTQPWTHSEWQSTLVPTPYRDDLWIQHDGVAVSSGAQSKHRPRTLLGRSLPEGAVVVTFAARSLDRLRGFDRFWRLAGSLLDESPEVVCAIVGDPVVHRGLDVQFNNRNYVEQLGQARPIRDHDRLLFAGPVGPSTVREVLEASDLHVALGRPYPVSRSLLEAMGAGCVVLASDTAAHREVLNSGENGLLVNPHDEIEVLRQARAVLVDRAGHRPLGQAAASLVAERYDHEVCVPRLAERFSDLAALRRR